jgi:hypothetical protein
VSDHDHDCRKFDFPKWSMVRMTILTMTILPFNHKMVMVKWSILTDISTISTNFKNFNDKKIWICRDCHDQIWIDQFDHENLEF